MWPIGPFVAALARRVHDKDGGIVFIKMLKTKREILVRSGALGSVDTALTDPNVRTRARF